MDADRPIQVTRAVRLLWISLGLGLFGSIAVILGPLPEPTYMSRWLLSAVVVLTFSVMAALTRSIAHRRNWARVTLLIFTLIGLVSSVLSRSSPAERPWYSIAVEGATTCMSVLALFWLFSGEGANWYRRK